MWYKATRPDGTSFADGTTLWEVGKTVKIAKQDQRNVLCRKGLLHISDAPAETLVGGSWPCRLFKVRAGRVITQRDHKAGCWSVKVLEELPAWQALGPNGQEVAALIERAKTLSVDKVRELDAAAWDAAQYAARDAAWDAARDTARETARYAAWDTAGYAAQVAAQVAAETAPDAAWDAARDAAWDAAGALVVKDLITPDQFDILSGPWGSVIG